MNTEMETRRQAAPASPAPAPELQQMLEAMQQMAMLLRTMNGRVQDLEAQVRRLEKVTPSQATAINAAIRTRASAVCALHRAAGCEKAAAAAIRKSIRMTCGINNIRELPRSDYKVAERLIGMWDDYDIMQKLKARRRTT